MQRRKLSREFKFEAVRVVRERGVSAAQAASGLDAFEPAFVARCAAARAHKPHKLSTAVKQASAAPIRPLTPTRSCRSLHR